MIFWFQGIMDVEISHLRLERDQRIQKPALLSPPIGSTADVTWITARNLTVL